MSQEEVMLELYRGDVLLAILSNIQLWDWPWYKAEFEPTTAFEQYKPLFDYELALLEDKGATEEWDQAYEKIEELDLTLSDPGQAKTAEFFLLHVDGETARFRATFD